MNTEIKELEEKVIKKVLDHEHRLTQVEERTRLRKLNLGSGAVTRELKSPFSISKAIDGLAGMLKGEDRWAEIGAKFERDVLMDHRTKALDSGTAGAGGGYLIPEEYISAEFTEPLRANATVIQSGAHLLTGLKGSPARIPRQLTSGTPYWVAENTTITLSNATFGDLLMTPKTMAMRTQVSRKLVAQGVPDIDALIWRDFAHVAALELDRVALRGAGTLEPVGLANTGSIPTYALGTDGEFVTFDALVDIVGMLEDSNAMVAGGKYGFIMNPKTKRGLKKLKVPQFSGDTGGAYLMPPMLTDQAIEAMVGYPIFASTQVRANLTKGAGSNLAELYFANWDDLFIAQWGGIEILATNIGGNAWAQNAIEVRLVMNVDIAMRNLESVVYVSDARTV
jgi:HK97 family phage major capsid protein